MAEMHPGREMLEAFPIIAFLSGARGLLVGELNLLCQHVYVWRATLENKSRREIVSPEARVVMRR